MSAHVLARLQQQSQSHLRHRSRPVGRNIADRNTSLSCCLHIDHIVTRSQHSHILNLRTGFKHLFCQWPAEKVVERIGDAEAVITNKTPLTKEVFEACPQIQYVGIYPSKITIFIFVMIPFFALPSHHSHNADSLSPHQFSCLLTDILHRDPVQL